MVNKFKVGDLVEYAYGNPIITVLGVVTDCGLEYPDHRASTPKHRFVQVRWSDGDNTSIWEGYGSGWKKTKVIIRNEK